MQHHVEHYVKSCDACQKNKARHHKNFGTPQIPDIPSKPWEWMSVDFCGTFPKTKEGNDYIAGFICNLVREAILVPCTKNVTAKQTVKLFVKYVMPRTGIPERINSDRGPQFISNFWKNLWKLLGTELAFSAPYHANSNALIERQNKTFIENLKSYINARQDDWEDHIGPYEFAYNNSYNKSIGDTPFFLSHGRQPAMPVASLHKTPSPAAEDFILNLQNRIAMARDHIRRKQGDRADTNADSTQPANYKVGDKVLLSTEHYNLQLPSEKLAPRWLGPLEILEIRGPNTVRIEVPPKLSRIEPLQNVLNLKPYHERPPEIGPTNAQAQPDLVDGEEEYEVEDILAHRAKGRTTEYLVRFVSCGPEDDLWLPEKNLVNAPDILKAYHDRQKDTQQPTRPRRQLSTCRGRAPRPLVRNGHLWHTRS